MEARSLNRASVEKEGRRNQKMMHVAASVLQVIDAGEYSCDARTVRFKDEQTCAVNGTRLYSPEQLALLEALPGSGTRPTICVTSGTTQVIAHDVASYAGEGRVAVLNFASAMNPGGGFLNDVKSQEEDLCRCSGLYPCLLQCMEYYDMNRSQSSKLYTDYAIFSPQVPFFKTNGTGGFLSVPFFVSVITAPAPNSGPFLREEPEAIDELRAAFLRRWRNVLRIARDQGITQLLLGAWGCGVFGGDPVMASETAKEAILSDGAGIDEIVFAIPCSDRRSKINFEAFQRTFS